MGTVDDIRARRRRSCNLFMAASSPEDAPKGIEFLDKLNRFNVSNFPFALRLSPCGTSPRLLSPECRTLRQMELANVACVVTLR